MRFYFTLILIVLSTINTYSQNRGRGRIGAREQVEIKEYSDKLLKATGWCQNYQTKRWIGNENFINDEKGEDYDKPNFQSIQILKIEYQDSMVYCLKVEDKLPRSWSGTYDRISLYLFTSEQYFSFIDCFSEGEECTIEFEKYTTIDNRRDSPDGLPLLTEDHIIATLTSLYQTRIIEDDEKMAFLIDVNHEEDVVRFVLPFVWNSRDMVARAFATKNFRFISSYFETNTSSFKKLF